MFVINLAVTTAFADALNPLVLTTVIFFLIGLNLLCGNAREVFWGGAIFILAAFLTIFARQTGWWVLIFESAYFYGLAKIFYFGLAVILIGLGTFFLKGWQRRAKEGSETGTGLERLCQTINPAARSWLGWGIWGLVWMLYGFIFALFQMTYPSTPFFYAAIYGLIVEGHRPLAALGLFAYSAVLFIPMIGLWILILCLTGQERWKAFKARCQRTLNTIISALLLGWGLGLIFLLFQSSFG